MPNHVTRDAGGLTLHLDWRGVVFGLSARTVRFATVEIVTTQQMTAAEARQLLRWRVAGTALPAWWLQGWYLMGWYLMGWFSRTTRGGRWAWVWITPTCNVLAIETTRRRRSLIIVPTDWLVRGSESGSS